MVQLFFSYSKNKAYNDGVRGSGQYHEKFFRRLNQELGKSIYVGSLNSNYYGISEDEFYNDAHLLPGGAKIFTKRFAKNINNHTNLEPRFMTFEDYLKIGHDY